MNTELLGKKIIARIDRAGVFHGTLDHIDNDIMRLKDARRIYYWSGALSVTDMAAKVTAKELFDWHNTLTGSCLMGRKHWCKDHGINVEADTFTVKEFIELTKGSYGGNTIKKLLKLY